MILKADRQDTTMQLRIVLVVVCLLPTVFGCGCPPPPGQLESLCNDYQWSDDVFAGRVINSSCNCIPPPNDTLTVQQIYLACRAKVPNILQLKLLQEQPVILGGGIAYYRVMQS